MTIRVSTRLTEVEVLALDELVANGGARSRSHAIRLAVGQLVDAHRREQTDQSIVDAYTARPQDAEDDELAMANAVAMTADEPW